MTRNADNQTTELREKLTERGVEYTTNDHLGAYETSWDGFTAMQLTPSAKLIMVVTPKQAIAATLGSEREIELSDALNEVAEKWASARVEAQSCAKRCILLEELVRDLIPFVCADDGIDGIEARMKALGIEVIDE